MDPKGKASAPTPPYRRDAQRGYLPSVPFPHAGPEPSGQAPRSFLKENTLDGSRGAFSLVAIGMEYESGPPDSDNESSCDLDDPDGPEDCVECCIVATFFQELEIPCQNPDCPIVSSRQQSTNSGDRDSSARSLASDRPDNVIQTTSIIQSTDRITTDHRQNYERIISDY